MRIYSNPVEAFREVERDLFELGIQVQPQTMQDKFIGDNPDYLTTEVRAYGFSISRYGWNRIDERDCVNYIMKDSASAKSALDYIELEFGDRVSGRSMNPGNSWKARSDVWNEFMHDGKFAYTYSERMAPQVSHMLEELRVRPESRQAIINIHSNIAAPATVDGSYSDFNLRNDYGGMYVYRSVDIRNMGGRSRIPCSMYYQLMIRDNKVDLIYTMRSCDFLTHFPVDVMLALRLQRWFAQRLSLECGTFTYFTGSLHAYHKDLKTRGIF